MFPQDDGVVGLGRVQGGGGGLGRAFWGTATWLELLQLDKQARIPENWSAASVRVTVKELEVCCMCRCTGISIELWVDIGCSVHNSTCSTYP